MTNDRFERRAGAEAPREVALDRGGLVVSGRVVPLYAGSVHYWRLDPSVWRRALAEVRALGVRYVDTYVPWGVHEKAEGKFEFGKEDPRRDVAAFLRMVHELGLLAIVRPGPHINAELTYFGLPERVIYDPECQARTPKQNPVMLPSPPVAFPVPSYGSETFLRETRAWFAAVAPILAPLVYPAGPIVLVQIDNEGSLYFRDGAYDQDYRPEIVGQYRDFLRDRYGTRAALSTAYRNDDLAFETVTPPVRFDAESADDLARHLDWAEFQEELVARALSRMASDLSHHGLRGVPLIHNVPLGHEATPLSIDKLARAVDVVGIDYYYRANPKSALSMARRTTEIAAFAEGTGCPAFASEMGAGFPPFFPVLDDADNLFTAMTALAFGLRGINLYMAVGRDRWVGAPIDERGERQASFPMWRSLLEALDRVRFHELRRRAPVRVVVPAVHRRLARVMHAFGPVTVTAFASFGAGAVEGVFEDDLGLEAHPVLAVDGFAHGVESALVSRGVPFARIAGDVAERSLGDARWIVCASGGALEPGLLSCLRTAAERGARVSIGPCRPLRDGTMRMAASDASNDGLFDWKLELADWVGGLDAGAGRGGLDDYVDGRGVHEGNSPVGAREAHERPRISPPLPSVARFEQLVDEGIASLGLSTFAVDPPDVLFTIHEDEAGVPRAAFVINPRSEPVRARVAWGQGAHRFRDLLEQGESGRPGSRGASSGAIVADTSKTPRVLELAMAARSVRMLAVEPT